MGAVPCGCNSTSTGIKFTHTTHNTTQTISIINNIENVENSEFIAGLMLLIIVEK